MLGVTNEVPVPNEVPPEEAAYQFNVPLPFAVAPKVTVPVPQREAGVVEATDGLFTVTETVLEGEVEIGVPPQLTTNLKS